jgi:hypothetical protein
LAGDHDDGHVLVELPDPAQDLDPVEPGHPDVEQDKVRPTPSNHGQGLEPATRRFDGIPLGGEVLGQHFAHGGFIVNDQDPPKGHQPIFYPRDAL